MMLLVRLRQDGASEADRMVLLRLRHDGASEAWT
jgi:hypothetical protein